MRADHGKRATIGGMVFAGSEREATSRVRQIANACNQNRLLS